MGESSLNYDFDDGDGEVSIEEYLHALEKALLPSGVIASRC